VIAGVPRCRSGRAGGSRRRETLGICFSTSCRDSRHSTAALNDRDVAKLYIPSPDDRENQREPRARSRLSLSKHIILFLAANPLGTTELALGREARAIQEELERSGQRDRFEFVTRWAVQPLDVIRELRRLKPTVVHFSGHGRDRGRQQGTGLRRDIVAGLGGNGGTAAGDHPGGLFLQGPDGHPQLVTAVALRETFGSAGTSVKLVVLNACYSGLQAEALLVYIDCVVGVHGSLRDDTARAFAIGFYGGLGELQSVAAAYLQGCAAISLEEPPDGERPQLRVAMESMPTKSFWLRLAQSIAERRSPSIQTLRQSN
jgi:hypothetical protein